MRAAKKGGLVRPKGHAQMSASEASYKFMGFAYSGRVHCTFTFSSCRSATFTNQHNTVESQYLRTPNQGRLDAEVLTRARGCEFIAVLVGAYHPYPSHFH